MDFLARIPSSARRTAVLILACTACVACSREAPLFNEGLIAEKSGDPEGARNYFTQSLALRPASDPGRATVEKELLAVGGTPAAPPPETRTPVCKIAAGPPEYASIDIEQNETSGLGTFDVAYRNAPARHFKVKVVAWPKGCPWVEPMPESPSCHGAFLSYQLVFQGYGAGDTKPAGEKLVAGKTVLVRVVQEMSDDANVVEQLEPGDWVPTRPIPSMKACTK